MKISEQVQQVLARCETDNNLLTLPEQLDRKDYMAVDKVLKALGGKWNRKQKAHVFDFECEEIIEQALSTGEYTDKKKELQAFYTPEGLAERMVILADIQEGDVVLEPSAGAGNILKAVVVKKPSLVISVEIDKTPKVFGEACNVLKTEQGCKEWAMISEDFLSDDATKGINGVIKHNRVGATGLDIIISNPPFSRQQDIDHVNKMIDLKPSKRIVAIMSAGVMFRTNKKTTAFRDRVSDLGGRFVELPAGTFAESGTQVKTAICIIGE